MASCVESGPDPPRARLPAARWSAGHAARPRGARQADGSPAIAELLAPRRCLACRRRGHDGLCERCLGACRRRTVACLRCGAPRGRSHACWSAEGPIGAVRAPFDYAGPIPVAIRTAKLGGARRGWAALSEHLAERVTAAPVAADVVTWVATPSSRARRRSGDHAALLAAALGRRLELPVLRLLGARARRGAPDRYVYAGPRPIPGSDILLVDDVLTTGATASRAAGVLRAHGAGRIALGVVARAGQHPLS